MTVNGVKPDANGDVAVDLSGIVELKGKVARLNEDMSSAQSAIADRYTKSETDEKIAAATPSDYDAVKGRVAAVEAKVPAQASAQNQLADKAFVNSSIATNTAFYISDGGRPFQSLADLENYEGALTNNDYAFVVGRDAAGNTTYTRYKWSEATETWAEEFVLNNSSFTAAQWEAISSGITSGLVAKLDALPTAEALAAELSNIRAVAQNAAASAEAANINVGLCATKAELNNHAGNSTVHVTAAERAEWNAKQSALPLEIGQSGKESSLKLKVANSTYANKATAPFALALGYQSEASAARAFTTGTGTKATALNAHAEGALTEASAVAAHAEGRGTKATNANEHAEGQYNVSHSGAISSIGIGSADNDRKNAVAVMLDGRVYVNGLGGYVGTTLTGTSSLQKVITDLLSQPTFIAEYLYLRYHDSTKEIVLGYDDYKIATIDATAFIKDGMVSNVAIENGNIVIMFNTDAGKEPISIPLTDIFDPNNYVAKTVTTTWSALRTLKNNSALVPGQKYRITDYATTTRRSGTQSANHPFDVIVTAVSTNELAAEASAAPRSGNSYFANADLGKWRLWYSLENDTNRFDWATSDGKGVVYRMIDEFGNDCPYDFKNIQFAKPLDNTTVYCYTFDGGWNQQGARRAVDFSLDGSGNFIFGNKIAPYSVEVTSSYYMQQKLNAIVFLGYNVEQNTFAEDCRDMLFGQKTVSSANVKWNKFGNACHDNNFGSLFVWNTVGTNVSGCTYTYTSSTPQTDVSSPIYWCHSNTIGDSCNNITLTRSCRGNSFGALNTGINLATGCASNEFGASCAYLDIGRQCVHNAFAPGYAGADGAPVAVSANTENRSFVKTQGANGSLAKVAVTGSYNDLSDKPVIDVSLLTEVLWGELKVLRDNGELKPGRQYRIIDYVATTNGNMDSRSANHSFDIIVTADDEYTLNEHARAIIHDGELPDDIVEEGTAGGTRTRGYFAYCDLAAWDVWYCINNDIDRFDWADDVNGRGVIYRLVDEFQNDAPYDFKGIQFRRWAVTDVTSTKLDVDSLDELKSSFIKDSNGGLYYARQSSDISVNDTTLVVDGSDSTWYYTFGGTEDLSCAGFVNSVYANVIAGCAFSRKYTLNNIVFFGTYCCSNTFGFGCHSNTFGPNCYFNTFGPECSSNTFGFNCSFHTFGSECYSNIFGTDCYSNTLGPNCYSNIFGVGCGDNTFGSSGSSNTFGSGCQSNAFDPECYANTFGSYCSFNTFGHTCFSNMFGSFCGQNTFGTECYDIRFGTASSVKSYCRYVRVGSGNGKLYINPTGTTSSSQYYQNVEIKEGVNNTLVYYKTIDDPNVSQTFLTTYKPANSQEISV